MKGKKLNTLFKDFTDGMKERLNYKQSEGWTGWNDKVEYPDKEFQDRIFWKLRNIEDEIDYLDIANYAMFLYHRFKEQLKVLGGLPRCSFCNKKQDKVKILIKSTKKPYSYICEDCIDVCVNILVNHIKKSGKG